MPLRLRVIPSAHDTPGEAPGPTTERIVEFPDDASEIRIGRSSDLDLSLPFKSLSSLHARLVRKKAAAAGGHDTWVLEDLESKNGTFIGKHRLKPGEQRLMLAGTEIDLAQVRVVFDGISRPLSGAEGTGTIARRLVSDLFQGSPDLHAPTLTVIDGADNVTTLKLTERDKAYYVGRSSTCDLYFAVEELSRKHASFTRGEHGIVVRDLDSKNGITVNGLKAVRQRVRDGDVIEMGPLKLRLKDPEDKYLRDLEGEEQGAPSKPPVAISMPWAKPGTPVSTPAPPGAAPAPPPIAPPPAGVESMHPMAAAALATPASKSRFGRTPAASAVPPQAHLAIDELHPALAARRPAPDAGDSNYEPTMVRKAHRTMFIAVAVLVIIVVVALVILLGGSGSTDE